MEIDLKNMFKSTKNPLYQYHEKLFKDIDEQGGIKKEMIEEMGKK